MDALSTSQLTAEQLAAQLGTSYERFDASEQARHLALLQQVQRPSDIALDARPAGGDRWRVTICTADCAGLLSIIAGLFTAYHCDIIRAEIFTVRVPMPTGAARSALRRRPGQRVPSAAAPVRRVLDIFEVRAPTGADAELWRQFRQDLDELVELIATGQEDEARNRIIDRVSDALGAQREQGAPLLPVSVEIDTEPGGGATQLTIRSADTPGFLFAFTNAVAGFAVNIERAEVRTVDGQAQDTFWVTDLSGQPVTSPSRVQELRVAAVLIKQFTYLLPHAPNPAQALRQFHALVRQLLQRPNWTADLRSLEVPAVLETLAELLGESRFLWEDFLRLQHENLFPVLVDVPALDLRRSKEELRAELQADLRAESGAAGRVDALNRFKDREMFRIDLRHITQRIDFAGFSAELSALAEVVVEAAAALAEEALRGKHGSPRLADGRPCAWCVGALGKFGGAELGFGSDLELLFVYAGEGTTTGPAPIDNGQYFAMLVQEFLSIVRVRQAGIFEIDLRLRPYGKAGPLASSLDGFARYYAPGGDAQQFERMALVKLRPVAGDPVLGERLMQARDAFVYSGEPLDVENIRHLRRRQATELVPVGSVNAKYSPGGLVDAEYFVQAAQIIAGKAHPQVRVSNTLVAIDRLVEVGRLPEPEADRLRETYIFLRRLIDALRVVRGNARDLTIPDAASREFAYLAQRLRYPSPSALQDAIVAHMATARALWDHEQVLLQ